MEMIKKPVAENTTATSPENLSEQEITTTNAEKATTGETKSKPKGDQVMVGPLDRGAQVPTDLAKSDYSMKDWPLESQTFVLSPDKETAASQTMIDPEDFMKSFQRPALKNKRKVEMDEPSMEASKKVRTVYWSTPALSDRDADLDMLSDFVNADPLARATDPDEESRRIYAVPHPSWNSDEEDSGKHFQVRVLTSLLIMLDATSDETDPGLSSDHEEDVDDESYSAYVKRINETWISSHTSPSKENSSATKERDSRQVFRARSC